MPPCRAVFYQHGRLETAEYSSDDLSVVGLAVVGIGAAQFAEDPWFLLTLASFHGTVRNDAQTSVGTCEKGKKGAANMIQRFGFYLLIRQHQQKQSTEQSAESGMDLASYVEFQNSFKVLIRSHKAVLKANRNFWFGLLHQDIKLSRLTHGLRRIDTLTQRVEQNYRSVLERYPKSVRLLRSYAHFLEEARPTWFLAAGLVLETCMALANRDDAPSLPPFRRCR